MVADESLLRDAGKKEGTVRVGTWRGVFRVERKAGKGGKEDKMEVIKRWKEVWEEGMTGREAGKEGRKG